MLADYVLINSYQNLVAYQITIILLLSLRVLWDSQVSAG